MKLQDICILKTDFPEADFWIERKGSENNVGKPKKTFSNEDIGVKVREEFLDKVDSGFLYYYFMYLHQSGVFINMSHGTLQLKHIRLSDIKSIPISFQETTNENKTSKLDIYKNMKNLYEFEDTPDDLTNLLPTFNSIEKFVSELCEIDANLIDHFDTIVKEIEKSGCQVIEFKPFNFPAAGLCLHDKVLINVTVKFQKLEQIFYIIFHEIAHQYQFKKYGMDTMYDVYTEKIDISDAIKSVRYYESVADQYGIRKCRELANLNILDKNKLVTKGNYENIPDTHLGQLILNFRKKISDMGVTTPERISEIFYNNVIKTQ